MGNAYTCPICHQEISRDMVQFLNHAKAEIVTEIKKKHPNWNSDQGICPRCETHYQSWFDQLPK